MLRNRMLIMFSTVILLAALLFGLVSAASRGSVLVYAQTTPITFDNMTLLSPNGQQVVYVTAQDLGMTGSAIWLANADGSQSAVLVAGDSAGSDYWVTNPIWSPDNQQIAYVKAVKEDLATDFVSYRYEIWAIHSDGSNNRLLTNTFFSPSLGYGGQTNLVWNATNEVEFPGGAQSSYAVNVTTLAIHEIGGQEESPVLPNSASISGVPAYSQHDSRWASNTINPGYGCTYTIGGSGGAITATAMVLDYMISGTIQPNDVNNAMTGFGFDQDNGNPCWIRWAMLANPYQAIEVDDTYVWGPPLGFDEVRREISGGVPLILWYYENNPNKHFLVVTGYTGTTITVTDPSTGTSTNPDFYDYDFQGAVIIQKDAYFSKITPALNATGVDTANITLEWAAMVPTPDSYRYCLYIDGVAGQCADNSGQWTSTQSNTYANISNTLLGNTDYRWQVQAKIGTTKINANGGQSWKFTTLLGPTPTRTRTPAPSLTPTITPPPTITPTPTATGVPVTVTFTSVASVDGWVLESTETSGVGGTINNNNVYLFAGDDGTDRQYRSILSFSTASLPDTAIIDSAQVKIKEVTPIGINPFTIANNYLRVDLFWGTSGASSALQTDDFNSTASYQSAGLFNPIPVGLWHSSWLNLNAPPGSQMSSTGPINRFGPTQMRIRFTFDDNDNAQTDVMRFYSGDAGADQPQLIVIYHLP